MTTVVGTLDQQFDVYIGRAGRGMDGTFGNPYPVGQVCRRCKIFHSSAAGVISCFKAYFEERVVNDQPFRARVLALKDKRLGCPGNCKSKGGLCHGDVIAAWVEANKE